MPVEIQVRIDPRFGEQIRLYGVKALQGFQRGLAMAGLEIAKDAKELIRRSPRGGRAYRVRKTGKQQFQVASRPGSPPATDTGNLINSITRKVEDPLTVIVEAAAGYSGYLEDGTHKMAARPFLRPAVQQSEDAIDRIISDEIDRATR